MPLWAAVVASWITVGLALWVAGPGRVALFPPEVPAQPAGVDLGLMLNYSRAWLETGNPFWELNPYPPLTAVAFAPLTALPFPAALALMTALTLAAYLSVTVLLPLCAFPNADRAAVLAVALAGLCSYGLWYEVRWGQFNVVALACAGWGLYLFHRGRGRGARWAAYGLFSAAIQLKVFPAIFVLALAREPRPWPQNVARWAWLGTANLALLFALGPHVLTDFLLSLQAQAIAPYVWSGNHSIQSFTEWAGRPGLAPVLALVYGASLLASLVGAARRWDRESLADLILVCALGTMLVPGVSHDYKLTAFPMALAFWVAAMQPLRPDGEPIPWALLRRLGLCLLFAWTLFSYGAKPAPLQNNAPFLLAAALLVAMGRGLRTGNQVEVGSSGSGSSGSCSRPGIRVYKLSDCAS